MLILDNLLLSPLLWIFREINDIVEKEEAGAAEAVTRSLGELYMKLDSGAITEEQFEAAETQLLDRLDAIRDRDAGLSQASGSDEEDDDVDSEEDEDDQLEEEEEEIEEEEMEETPTTDFRVDPRTFRD